MMGKAKILTIGLTPARQQTVRLHRLSIGAVNRAQEVRWCTAGKALDVAIALATLRAAPRVLTLLGGPTRREMIAELEALGVICEAVDAQAPPRSCTTIVEDDGVTTELVENGPPVAAAVVAEAMRRAQVQLPKARAVVLSGSLPEGCSAAFYADLLKTAGPRVVVDASGSELLACLEREPLVVKPNRLELARTLGRSLDDDGAVWTAMQELQRRGARWVVVSDGAEKLRLLGPGVAATITPPRVHLVNPIGAGDCLAAGLALRIAEGAPVEEAARYGVACAAASAETLLPARLSLARVKALSPEIALQSVR